MPMTHNIAMICSSRFIRLRHALYSSLSLLLLDKDLLVDLVISFIIVNSLLINLIKLYKLITVYRDENYYNRQLMIMPLEFIDVKRQNISNVHSIFCKCVYGVLSV